jgi:hypothetical protein
VVEKILRSMPQKFNYVVCSIEESNDVTTLWIDELQSSLLVHEQRMQGQKDQSEDKLLRFPMLEEVGEEILHEVVEEVGRARHWLSVTSVTNLAITGMSVLSRKKMLILPSIKMK